MVQFESFLRVGLAGVGTKLSPFPKAIFSMLESLVLERLVMKCSLSDANCVRRFFLLKCLWLEHLCEKRLAFCLD